MLLRPVYPRNWHVRLLASGAISFYDVLTSAGAPVFHIDCHDNFECQDDSAVSPRQSGHLQLMTKVTAQISHLNWRRTMEQRLKH